MAPTNGSLLQVTKCPRPGEQVTGLLPVSGFAKVRLAFQHWPVPFCACKPLWVEERDSHRVWRPWERADQEVHPIRMRSRSGPVSQVGLQTRSSGNRPPRNARLKTFKNQKLHRELEAESQKPQLVWGSEEETGLQLRHWHWPEWECECTRHRSKFWILTGSEEGRAENSEQGQHLKVNDRYRDMVTGTWRSVPPAPARQEPWSTGWLGSFGEQTRAGQIVFSPEKLRSSSSVVTAHIYLRRLLRVKKLGDLSRWLSVSKLWAGNHPSALSTGRLVSSVPCRTSSHKCIATCRLQFHIHIPPKISAFF